MSGRLKKRLKYFSFSHLLTAMLDIDQKNEHLPTVIISSRIKNPKIFKIKRNCLYC